MNRTYKRNPNDRIIHKLERPITERLKYRKIVGPYIITPVDARAEKRSFYLDSDFMPISRWAWCNSVCDIIEHDGWYCSQHYGDTVHGVVFTLPHNKGFLAGWAMGKGMLGELDTYIYSTKKSAALASNSWAQRVAEDMLDEAEDYLRKDKIATAKAQLHANNKQALSIIKILKDGIENPTLSKLAKDTLQKLVDERTALFQTMKG